MDADDKNEPGFTSFGNWQITGGSGSSVFAIDPGNGLLTIKNSSVFHDLGRGSYSLVVTVSDGLHTSAGEEVNVAVSSKVKICYNGNTITLPRDKVPTYLAKGAVPGECITDIITGSSPTALNIPGTTLQVYPNPIRNRFTVSLGENELHIRKVELVDISGRVILQVSAAGRTGNLAIDIPRNRVTQGIYFIRMQGDTIITKKVLIQ